MNEGDIYYCNDCAPNLITDMLRVIDQYNKDHAPWDAKERADSTYTWEDAIDLSGMKIGTGTDTSVGGVESGSEGSISEPNQSGGATTDSDAVSDSTISFVHADERESRDSGEFGVS